MFSECVAKKPVTAWTIPGRSGQERVRIMSFEGGDILVVFGSGLGIWAERRGDLVEVKRMDWWLDGVFDVGCENVFWRL